MGANKILEVMNYSYYYDQICAVRELSFHVNGRQDNYAAFHIRLNPRRRKGRD